MYCPAVLIGWDPPPQLSPSPRIWAHIRGRYWSANLFVTPLLYRVYNGTTHSPASIHLCDFCDLYPHHLSATAPTKHIFSQKKWNIYTPSVAVFQLFSSLCSRIETLGNKKIESHLKIKNGEIYEWVYKEYPYQLTCTMVLESFEIEVRV